MFLVLLMEPCQIHESVIIFKVAEEAQQLNESEITLIVKDL